MRDLSVAEPGAWVNDAACLGTDPAIFFDRDGKEARVICRGCMVRSDCLAFAVDTHQDHGFWAGTSPRERVMIRRKARLRR